ncbi:CHAP domain-containing protein [Actinomadura rudentiformis]|uniref:CHAP domain-containing protein n=1 Tax=Actinomadura rudentiformis TaxID=359158 RepID=A0A6H9YZI9_9ACTN|nr:CHAP domain-containing protein [Actinomadura rudentiformis]KAB2352230.1 CHAP domain-containing protein [Actinomadura rudentiformis]
MDPVGKKLLDVAKSQLGYREKAGGYTKFGDWYSKNVDDDSYFKTAPWCDMFLAWAANQADVQDWVGEFAATIEHAKWFKKQDAWGTKPEPGALVFFAWSGSKDIDAIGHVGLVEKVDGRTLTTIEANTDAVFLKRKTRDVKDVVGYGYPAKVQVKGKSLPAEVTAQATPSAKYAPKHAAPAPSVTEVTAPPSSTTEATQQGEDAPLGPLPMQEAVLTGTLALVVAGTVALAVGRSTATKLPAASPVRVRKRGKHHRTPVELPAEITPAALEAADASTAVMPAITAAVAAEAEDREFWGRVAHLSDDQDLAFWDTLHAEFLGPRADSGDHAGMRS